MLGNIFEICKKWKTKRLKRKMKPQRYVKKCSLHHCGTQNSEKLEFKKERGFAAEKGRFIFQSNTLDIEWKRTSDQTNPKPPFSAESPQGNKPSFKYFTVCFFGPSPSRPRALCEGLRDTPTRSPDPGKPCAVKHTASNELQSTTRTAHAAKSVSWLFRVKKGK